MRDLASVLRGNGENALVSSEDNNFFLRFTQILIPQPESDLFSVITGEY